MAKHDGMTVRECGAYVRVTVHKWRVEAFKDTWPCSGLPDCAITFEFQRDNGDLTDLWGTKDYDGDDLLALSHDASNTAAKVLNAPELAR